MNKPIQGAWGITTIYVIVGSLWILLSDRFVSLLSTDPEFITSVSTFKGWMFIGLTGWMLHSLISRLLLTIEKNQEISKVNYRAIFNAANDGIFVHDAKTGEVLDVNDKACELYGLPREELIALDIHDAGTGESPYSEHEARKLVALAAAGEPQLFEWVIRCRDGKHLLVEVSLRRAVIGNRDCVLSAVRDISLRKRQETELSNYQEELVAHNEELRATNEELNDLYSEMAIAEETLQKHCDELTLSKNLLQQSEERYRLAIENANDAIYDWNLETNTVIWSGHWSRRLSLPESEIEGAEKVWEELIHPDDRSFRNQALEKHLSGETEIYTAEYRVLPPSGEPIWIMSRGSALRNKAGRPIRMIGSYANITEKKKQEEHIRFLAYHDTLTGLPNRAFFLEQMDRHLQGKAAETLSGAMFFIDLDNFKVINDTMGHVFGDDILIQVSRRLEAALGKEDILIRLGGDEFICYMPDISDRDAVEAKAAVISGTFGKPFDLEGQYYYLMASMGIALCPEHGVTVNDLLRNADAALYMLKKNTKGSWAFYEPSMEKD